MGKWKRFGTEAPFIGFSWNLENQTVSIPDPNKTKYLQAIFKWESKKTHNLQKVQKLYGKLLHACAVVPTGWAYLTNLEKFMTIFNNNPFMPHSPPHSTRNNLHWWKQTLSRSHITHIIPGPKILLDTATYSDASLETGIDITIRNYWRAWRLLPGWKEDGVETLVGWKPLASSSLYSPYLKAALHTQITKSSETTKVLLKAGGKEEAVTWPQTKSLNWYMKKVSN